MATLTALERQCLSQRCSGTYKPDSTGAYTGSFLVFDLLRVRKAWDRYQSRRKREAVYSYLKRVYFLVRKWFRLQGEWPEMALSFHGEDHTVITDPFAIAIYCTSDRALVDRKMRSKWSRALRYVHARKPQRQTIAKFMQSRGGVNGCAQAFTRSNASRGRKSGR